MRTTLNTRQSVAAIVRATVLTLMALMALPASAADGDRWMELGLQTSYGSNKNGEALYCMFEVVSEDDATVQFVPVSSTENTLGSDANVSDSFWLYEEVIHDGKTYTVVAIGDYAFQGMPYVREVSDIGYNIKRIGNYAFEYCPKLEVMALPDPVESIGNYAFSRCYNLVSTSVDTSYGIELPQNLKRIGKSAFSACWALEKVTFPDGLESMGDYPFISCTGLTTVNLPSSIEVGVAPFYGCSRMTAIYTHNVEGKTSKIGRSSDARILFKYLDNGERELVQLVCGVGGDYTIPDYITHIGDYALGKTSFSSLHIPSTIRTIGKYAFDEANLLEKVYVEWVSKDDFPEVGTNPFYVPDDVEVPVRTLYIPKTSGTVSGAAILQDYQSSKWNNWFAYIDSYTPSPVEGLQVGGYNVSRVDVGDIRNPNVKTGRISYDLATRTLTLDNATIETNSNEEYGILNSSVSNLTVKLIDNNSIHNNAAGIVSYHNISIEGPGKLDIISEYEEAIFIEAFDVYIQDADLYLYGQTGAIVGKDQARAYIYNSSVKLSPNGAVGETPIMDIDRLELIDCHIETPLFARYDSEENAVVDYKDDRLNTWITITPGNSYEVCFGESMITDLNCDDVQTNGLESGHVSFDPSDCVLTLDNVKFNHNYPAVDNNNWYLKVHLVGDNYLNTNEPALWLIADALITGPGKLYITTSYDSGIRLMADWVYLEIEDTRVDIKGRSGAIWGTYDKDNQCVYVYNSTVNLSGGGYKVVTQLDAFGLYDCHFVKSAYYFNGDEGSICDGWDDPVYDDIAIVPDVPTAIDQPAIADMDNTDAKVYNLQGQRVAPDYKGVKIVKGRKTL